MTTTPQLNNRPAIPHTDVLRNEDISFINQRFAHQKLFNEMMKGSFVLIRSFPEAKRNEITCAFHRALNQTHPKEETIQETN